MIIKDLLDICESQNKRLHETAVQLEIEDNRISKDELYARMDSMYTVMEEGILNGVRSDEPSNSGLTGADGKRMFENASGIYTKAAGIAMGIVNINAAMGRIVATPTAGSSGILPAVIYVTAQSCGADRTDIINALFTAGAVGKVIAEVAGISGAQGGCQFECGAAAAMAAAAAVEMRGGTPVQSAHAVAFCLKAVMGLVCDPVAGLVEVPCIKRNAFGAVQSLLAADMAMCGITSVIPADEVIAAMAEVGAMLHPSLKETADGGVANTPTAKCICSRLM